MVHRTLLACFWVGLACRPTLAMPSDFDPQAAEARQAGLTFANDARVFTWGLFLDEDRYYSQGLHGFWSGLPHGLAETWLPLHAFGDIVAANAVMSMVRFGQDLFTPNDLRVTPPLIPDDRPFCGWTHLDLAERFYFNQGQNSARLHVQVDLGVVGPASLGKEVQTWYHAKRRLTSSHPELDPDPSLGWAHQYGAGFPGRTQLALNYARALPSLHASQLFLVESGTEADLNAGTLYGSLGIAAQIRAGWMTRSLYTPQLQRPTSEWEAFAFARTEAKAIGWNQIVTGEPSTQVSLARFTWQHSFGWILRGPNPWPEMSLSWSLWSRETEAKPIQPFQVGHTDYRPELQDRDAWFDHGFGTLKLAWLW